MPLRANVRVPVELRRGSRWFRLAQSVAEDGIELTTAAPEELDGPVEIAFHLPGDPDPISGLALLDEVRVEIDGEDRAERRAVRFVDVEPVARARIVAYIQLQMGLSR